eukprot:gene2527-4914_t
MQKMQIIRIFLSMLFCMAVSPYDNTPGMNDGKFIVETIATDIQPSAIENGFFRDKAGWFISSSHVDNILFLDKLTFKLSLVAGVPHISTSTDGQLLFATFSDPTRMAYDVNSNILFVAERNTGYVRVVDFNSDVVKTMSKSNNDEYVVFSYGFQDADIFPSLDIQISGDFIYVTDTLKLYSITSSNGIAGVSHGAVVTEYTALSSFFNAFGFPIVSNSRSCVYGIAPDATRQVIYVAITNAKNVIVAVPMDPNQSYKSIGVLAGDMSKTFYHGMGDIDTPVAVNGDVSISPSAALLAFPVHLRYSPDMDALYFSEAFPTTSDASFLFGSLTIRKLNLFTMVVETLAGVDFSHNQTHYTQIGTSGGRKDGRVEVAQFAYPISICLSDTTTTTTGRTFVEVVVADLSNNAIRRVTFKPYTDSGGGGSSPTPSPTTTLNSIVPPPTSMPTTTLSTKGGGSGGGGGISQSGSGTSRGSWGDWDTSTLPLVWQVVLSLSCTLTFLLLVAMMYGIGTGRIPIPIPWRSPSSSSLSDGTNHHGDSRYRSSSFQFSTVCCEGDHQGKGEGGIIHGGPVICIEDIHTPLEHRQHHHHGYWMNNDGNDVDVDDSQRSAIASIGCQSSEVDVRVNFEPTFTPLPHHMYPHYPSTDSRHSNSQARPPVARRLSVSVGVEDMSQDGSSSLFSRWLGSGRVRKDSSSLRHPQQQHHSHPNQHHHHQQQYTSSTDPVVVGRDDGHDQTCDSSVGSLDSLSLESSSNNTRNNRDRDRDMRNNQESVATMATTRMLMMVESGSGSDSIESLLHNSNGVQTASVSMPSLSSSVWMSRIRGLLQGIGIGVGRSASGVVPPLPTSSSTSQSLSEEWNEYHDHDNEAYNDNDNDMASKSRQGYGHATPSMTTTTGFTSPEPSNVSVRRNQGRQLTTVSKTKSKTTPKGNGLQRFTI